MNIGGEIPYRRSRLGRNNGIPRTGSLVFDRELQVKLQEAAAESKQDNAGSVKSGKGAKKPSKH